MKKMSGKFSLKDGSWTSASSELAVWKNETVSFEVQGTINTNGTANDFTTLIRLYHQYAEQMTAHVGGTYLAVIYDKATGRLTILQDRMTSPVTLYYTVYEGSLYYASSLKTLLCTTHMPRALNEEAVEEFLINGYLYGEQTLVRGVSKLRAGHALVAEKDQIRQVEVSYPCKAISQGEALASWKKTLDAAIERCTQGESEVNLPLSSGYDSSYILQAVAGKTNRPVNAFSIGGQFGKNELPAVRENIRSYPQVSLHTALTSQQTLQYFPDIVWRLEGAVFEVGIFLQYELARLVKQQNKRFLVCGECADQVMNENFLRQERMFPVQANNCPQYYAFDQYPYIFGSHLILKKNGILFNSFDIETRYPYLDERFLSVAQALALINGKDKRCHVANCRECLPPEVIANISKIGGSTEVHSLFSSGQERKRLVKYVEHSDFFHRHKDIITRHSYAAQERQTGLARMKTTIRQAILAGLGVNRGSRKKDAYFLEEMQLREYLCVLYLILFEKLIISGDDLNRESCSQPLAQMLNL